MAKTDTKRNKSIYEDYVRMVIEEKRQKGYFYYEMYKKWDLSAHRVWGIVKQEQKKRANEQS